MSANRILIYRDGEDITALITQVNNLPGSVIIDPAEDFEGEYTIVSLHQFQVVPTSRGWLLVALVEIVSANRMYSGAISIGTDAPIEMMQQVVEDAMMETLVE